MLEATTIISKKTNPLYPSQRASKKQNERTPPTTQKPLKPGIRKLKWKEEKELEVIEDKVIETEKNIAEVEKTFGSPDFFEKYGDKSQELQNKLDSLKMELESLYKRWDELEKSK